MNTRGGIRPGAGRPRKAEKRVRMWPSVKVTTKQKLTKLAFDKTKSLGEVVDSLAENSDKILVDIGKKKK